MTEVSKSECKRINVLLDFPQQGLTLSHLIDKYCMALKTQVTRDMMRKDLENVERLEVKFGVNKVTKNCKHYLREMLRINFGEQTTNQTDKED